MTNQRTTSRFLSRLCALSLLTVALVAGGVSAPALAHSGDIRSESSSGSSAREYVALGDSFTSGQGAPPYVADGTDCLRSKRASYPIFTDLISPYRLVANRACSGATVSNVVVQLTGVSASTKLVTLTVGGIDAGSNAVLAACAGSPTAPDLDCAMELGQTTSRLTALAAQLPGLYAMMATALPNARIAVLGYPLLFERNDSSVLDDLVNGGTVALNDVIKGSVLAAATVSPRIHFVDVTQEFARHGIGSAVPYIAFNPAGLASQANFHPNALGNSLGYTRALVNDGLLRW